jgi:hypothetical protein
MLAATPQRSRCRAEQAGRIREAKAKGASTKGQMMAREDAGSRPYNGMPAGDLPGARWRKSRRSSAQGNCVETAKLPGESVAVRNSRHQEGPALIFTKAEIRAFLEGVKDGDFDDLLQ